MDAERLEQLLQDPTTRRRATLLTLLFEAIRAFLVRLVGKKHGGFDAEFGPYTMPDFVLNPGSDDPPPRPLINRDCKHSYLIYNTVKNPVERCTLAGQLAALTVATDELIQYQQTEFRCENPDCPEPDGEIVWIGLNCDKAPKPTADRAAVMVRLWCRPQR